MDMDGKDKFEQEKGDEDLMSYNSPNVSSDWQFGGSNLTTNASMGSIPTGNPMAICKENLMESASSSTASLMNSFCATAWDHPVNIQNLGLYDINLQNNTTASNTIGSRKGPFGPSIIDRTLGTGWAPPNSMVKGGMFLPTVPGMLPQSLSQFPPDSGFIERAAKFSCFSGGTFGDMMNSVSISESMNPYAKGTVVMQRPQEVLAGNELNMAEASKAVSLPVEHGANEGSPLKNERKSDSFVRSDDEAKQRVGTSGNESDEAEFSGGGGQEEPSNLEGACREPSSKALGLKKRKRGGQRNELGQIKETSQPPGESSKDNTEIEQKGDHTPTSTTNKPSTKHGKQGSQASDSQKKDYIHVRARRGQATNSHSLAERVRREKIAERMKFLQDLVPGCGKVTGKAVMLDEIINYVQSLQRQVEVTASVSRAPASLLPQSPSFASSTHTMPLPAILTRDPISPLRDKKNELTRKENPRQPIVKYPAENSYIWRKYGMKELTSGVQRGYYRCGHPGCIAKKKVQLSCNGQITETILRGLHNHLPPQPSAELTKGGHIGNLNKSEGLPAAYTLALKDASEKYASSEMRTVISSEKNKLHSGPPVLSTKTNQMVKQEAEFLKGRAWRCSKRKDLLLLLMSFPIKLEGDEVDFSLLWDNFIRLNQMMEKLDAISKEDMADLTNLGELMEDTHALLKDVENCLAKYDDDINLYFNKSTRYRELLEEHCESAVGSVLRQILKCLEWEQLRVIRIYGAHAQEVTRALGGLLEIRSMFQGVIQVTVFPCDTISEIRNRIAEKIHRLLGTDMSLPLDAALKPYKFLLLLHCTWLSIDPLELKIPEIGSVVLATSEEYDPYNMPIFSMMPMDEKRMLLDVQIRMEDHLLPWTLFWNKVSFTSSKVQRPGTGSVSFRPWEIEQVGTQLIQACHNNLLAIILLAKALESESENDVGVWKLALQELQSLCKPSFAVEGINEVMVRVLKFIWERKDIVTKHCIKQCTSATKDGAVKKHSLVAFWLENDLVKSEEEGELVLLKLVESSFLQEVGECSVRMQREIRDVLLSRFIPRLHPLYLMQEGLGLSKAPKVDEWDAREINLSNNHMSELPEKPNCRSLEKLFLQKNRDLMLIPPSFFECMPRLLILDLSYTSIQSFPSSITELVCLKELFLRGCELLTELPSEIGLLQALKVLDLEGTEIMYLPEELLKARQLTCFKVSLYGYGESYRESKQISKRIPKGLFAGFYWLEALSIDVNPDDEEWVADVKDIVYELLKLESLTTLKLYLPEVELLKEIASVQNFKFIVGHHKQRIISCLPQEVKEEFEKQENYLNYTNGKCIPTEIQNTLNRTGAFFLERHWTVKKLSEFGNENMVKLKFCVLVECNKLQTIIDGEEFCREGSQESVVDRKPVLELLEYLGVHCMMSLKSIWEGPVGKGSLSKLKYLALHDCPILSTIFTLSLLGNLCNLEELIVEDCPEIKSLVSQESSCSESSQFLPSLKKMSLLDLPELVSISSGFCIAPKLERIIIYACPMLESLSPAELSSDYLEVIKGEIEWWNSLKWNESEWSSTQQELMASVFVALKTDESLTDQLARS